jgi:hypothetical protein
VAPGGNCCIAPVAVALEEAVTDALNAAAGSRIINV